MHYVHRVDGVSGLFPIPTTENSRLYHRDNVLHGMGTASGLFLIAKTFTGLDCIHMSNCYTVCVL